MPQAIVDPAELRRFIQHLKKFNGEVLEQMQGANGNWSRWAPPGVIRNTSGFWKNSNNNCDTLSRFVDITNQYVPYLLRKAERIEEYLQQR